MGQIELLKKRTYVFFVENPISGDNVPRVRIPHDFIPQQIVAVKGDSASGQFDWELRHDPNSNNQGAGTLIHSALGVSNNNTGVIYNAPADFATITIPSGDYIWLELANVSTGLFRPVWCSLTIYGVEKGS